jgi:hypothetical protein
MISPQDERPDLDREEEAFVERLAEGYAPARMTPAECAEFDAGIRARLERPWRRWLWIPAVGVAAVAALLWLVASLSIDPLDGPAEEGLAAVAASSWEDELFLSSDFGASEDREESGTLPDDYLAIASVFLGG